MSHIRGKKVTSKRLSDALFSIIQSRETDKAKCVECGKNPAYLCVWVFIHLVSYLYFSMGFFCCSCYVWKVILLKTLRTPDAACISLDHCKSLWENKCYHTYCVGTVESRRVKAINNMTQHEPMTRQKAVGNNKLNLFPPIGMDSKVIQYV